MKTASRCTAENKGKHVGALILVLTSLIALCLTALRYFTPLSGITGAGGALLAMSGAFVLMIIGGILARPVKNCYRMLLIIIGWVGVIGTLAAFLLLHSWASSIFMTVGVLALAYESITCIMRRAA